MNKTGYFLKKTNCKKNPVTPTCFNQNTKNPEKFITLIACNVNVSFFSLHLKIPKTEI